MSGYTKLFSSILASTIWREDKDTRIVWITLLAMADRNGMAEGSIPGLADFARLSVDETRKALIKLESPDPDSRTQVDEGRRIRTVDGGWLLVNHARYRQKLNEDERREYKRVKQAQYRAEDDSNDAASVDTSGQVWTGVDNGGQPLTVLPNVTQAEAEASPSPKADAESKTRARGTTPIAYGPHRTHAFCSAACVPAFLHQEFCRGLNRANEDEADSELRQGYLSYIKDWPDDKATGDAIKFWRAWYQAQYPAPTAKDTKAAAEKRRQDEFFARQK